MHTVSGCRLTGWSRIKRMMFVRSLSPASCILGHDRSPLAPKLCWKESTTRPVVADSPAVLSQAWPLPSFQFSGSRTPIPGTTMKLRRIKRQLNCYRGTVLRWHTLSRHRQDGCDTLDADLSVPNSQRYSSHHAESLRMFQW